MNGDGETTGLPHMDVRAQLNELSGEWIVNRLWFSPGEPVRQSDSTASILAVDATYSRAT